MHDFQESLPAFAAVFPWAALFTSLNVYVKARRRRANLTLSELKSSYTLVMVGLLVAGIFPVVAVLSGLVDGRPVLTLIGLGGVVPSAATWWLGMSLRDLSDGESRDGDVPEVSGGLRTMRALDAIGWGILGGMLAGLVFRFGGGGSVTETLVVATLVSIFGSGAGLTINWLLRHLSGRFPPDS